MTATSRLVEACLTGTPPALVLASSSSVYGEAGLRRPQGEDDPLHPVSPYARSKVRAEELVFGARETDVEET